MQRKSIWTEEARVNSYETDFQKRWKPANFFQHMQEAATNHASHLGFDYTEMFARDMIWVLTRVKIRFFEFPQLRETVLVRTWPKGIQQKLFFMRDFEFLRADEQPLALVTSAWLLINVNARRMLLPQALPGELPDNQGRFALNESLDKINPSGLEEKFRVTPGYSAVDMMNHVNNARYIEWLADCFPVEMYQSHHLDWIQINYNNEVVAGETLSLRAGEVAGSAGLWHIEGDNLSSGARAFEAAASWSARQPA